MNIDMTKTLNQLAPLQIVDFVDVEHDEIKSVARESNGQFLSDRDSLSMDSFLAKYFPNKTVYDTIEAQEARRKALIKVAVKAKKTKQAKETILDQYGSYIVALWEMGDEFAASYRKTSGMNPQWHILSKHEIEYKKDGRKFSVVYHTSSRKDALTKKNELVDELVAKGLNYKGELPV
jgi:hypothetical protein